MGLFIFYQYLESFEKFDSNPTVFIRYILLFLAGHIFIFISPFLLKWDKSAYWNYLQTIVIAISRSILFSGVLYLGLVIALLSFKFLFDYEINEVRYAQLFIFCLGIINTWTYLSDFPKDVFSHTEIEYPKALEVFVKFILIPLLIVYLLILYAYSIKILIEWQLPKGWVSYLVLAYATLGFLIHIAINPIIKTTPIMVFRKFYPWFYLLLLPLIGLLFIAIGRRIQDYGITESRYFVLLLASWLMGVTLYILFSKRKQLRLLPISLFCLVLLSYAGPFGFMSVSVKSQVNRFKEIIEKTKANQNKITESEFDNLSSIFYYLEKNKATHELNAIKGLEKELFKRPIKEIVENKLRFTIIEDKFKQTLDDGIYKEAKNINFYNQNKNEVIEIKGYENGFEISPYSEDKSIGNNLSLNRIRILEYEILDKDKNQIIRFSLKNIVKKMKGIPLDEIPNDYFILEKENEKIKIKLSLSGIDSEEIKYPVYELGISGMIFYTIKQPK